MSDIDRAIHTAEDLLSQLDSENLVDMAAMEARGFPPGDVQGMSPLEYYIESANHGGAGFVSRAIAEQLGIDMDAKQELQPEAPAPTQSFDVNM